VGLAFGLSGPLFQRMLGNPLASPDFVGVSSGSGLFACAAIVTFHASGLAVAGASLVGGALSTALIYLLAWRGGIRGFRFILIGIGVSAAMVSLTGYLLSRATVWDARAAMTWLIGSVGQAGPDELAILCGVLVAAVPLALLLERQLRALELGDDAASALGTRVEPARLAIVAVVVVLIGCATAVAGPIPFVALMAGPIVARVLAPASGGLLAAGFTGAALVLSADLVAAHLMPAPLPTGVVTGLVGAPYLLWLLATANREGRGE
jgi:iron complex transport system permease protein